MHARHTTIFLSKNETISRLNEISVIYFDQNAAGILKKSDIKIYRIYLLSFQSCTSADLSMIV